MGRREVRLFLLWCAVFNILFAVCWVGMLSLAGGWVYRLHARWFPMPQEVFSAIHYGGLVLYRVLLVFFVVVPLLALWMTERKGR